MKKLFLHTLFVFLFAALNSCIEDNIAPPITGELNPAAELLFYFESNGDFVNSYQAPALVDAQEVYSNLLNYLIVDIRKTDDFIAGHIQGAINVLSDSLWKFMKSINAGSFQKIILVSRNGQSSAYFTCLLRLAGVNNVFSMKYGMAAWNQFFADECLDALGDAVNIAAYTDSTYAKKSLTDLPMVTFDNPKASLSERVNTRIKKIIEAGFYGVENIPIENSSYVVCYGNLRLYYSRRNLVLSGQGHPPEAVSYLESPDFEFRSVKFLQTLPNNKPITVYDYDGQLSACITAYLRVLGYDASSLLFGTNQLFYSRMIAEPDLQEYAFSSNKINNFPYVTGE
jgi:rhodanese-related sulfurtransferase